MFHQALLPDYAGYTWHQRYLGGWIASRDQHHGDDGIPSVSQVHCSSKGKASPNPMKTWRYFFPSAAAKSLQLCPTLCNPIDGSPPGSLIPGILQARTLEWVVISFSNAWKWKVKVKSLSCVWLLATPWTAAYQAPLSMAFSRQEYWSGLPFPSPMRESEKWKWSCSVL